MSIPATMKFIVRGKSVDFKNREGSSPSIPKRTTWLLNSLSYPFLVSGSKLLLFLIHYSLYNERKCCSFITCDIYYKWTSLSKESPFEWFTIDIFIHNKTYKVVLLTNYTPGIRLFNTLSIDIDPSSLVKWKWGWDMRNSRDSSVGRAEDWKSSCHQFKSGSWHMINLYESLFYQLIDMNTYSWRV